MSKTITKVIAVLGVVAGLGVATLPLGSYAASDIIVDIEIAATGAGVPECTSTDCFIPGTNNPAGQTITIKDKDSALYLCQSRLSDGATAGACANDNGASADATTAIKTLAAPTATLTTGASSTPLGWGIKFNAMTGYTPSGTITTEFQPSNATSIGTFVSSGLTSDQTLSYSAHASYASNTAAGFYTNTITLTAVNN